MDNFLAKYAEMFGDEPDANYVNRSDEMILEYFRLVRKAVRRGTPLTKKELAPFQTGHDDPSVLI
ncbi:MAG: hypothetical protein OXE47_02110 [Gammaproteobacteria bacterium]|nr:hypothetical protein [Gammaproteobacteria bacterium]